MKAVVVGGGKMGLPLACQFADNGATVTVADINPELVDMINAGEAPFEEPQLPEMLARNVKANRLKASVDTTNASTDADVIVIIVPALLTPEKDIDYGNLIAASKAVAKGMQKGVLVSYETTLPVGGCRANLVPVLEKTSGMNAGADFYVSFSPERVKSLLVFQRLQKTPKVVGGFDKESAHKAEEFYGKYLGAEVINVENLEAAEFVKLAGMLYRDMNIALVNEMAEYAEKVGVNFEEIRTASNTNGEAHLLIPGIGVGGHCTPVYPYFIIRDGERRGVPQKIAAMARAVNEFQPERQVKRLEDYFGSLEGKRIHILGLGFRPDVKEDAYSPAYPLKTALDKRNAKVTLEDPLYSDDEIKAEGFDTAVAGVDELDAVILNTSHSAFTAPDFIKWKKKGVRIILDGRNFWNADKIRESGIDYLSIGK